MKIAVVIPALDESEWIAEAIGSARPTAASSRIDAGGQSEGGPGGGPRFTERDEASVEVFVVDGGSRDDTCERARIAGARVVTSEPGRARQLQAGVEASTGDVILFLHADTRLPESWLAGVQGALAAQGVVGGAFALRYAEPGFGLRVVEWGARLRVRLFGLPYGDQGLFVRRDVLERIGGVPRVRLMEDLDLVRAMKREGRLALLPASVVSSGRRHLDNGVFRVALRHLVAALAWKLGVDRDRIGGFLGR